MDNKEKIIEIKNLLKESKFKNIKDDEGFITFEKGGFGYYILADNDENYICAIDFIDGCDYRKDFLSAYDEIWDEISDIENFIGNVEQGEFLFLKEIWKALEKLDDKYDEEQLEDIIKEKYGLF